MIRWTVDPLQIINAGLNLNRLGAVAADFYPDYYPFTNKLNQVAASRIGISWIVNSERVRLAGENLLIQVPSDWTRIQQENSILSKIKD